MDYHYNGDPSCSLTTSLSSTLSSYSMTITKAKKQRSPPPRKFKYKGVVPQPNGRWGAQLYNGNKRVWIGTYDTQHQAARAYDMAIIRFRGTRAITNFPIRRYGRLQLEFLASHSEARVIDMLRNHTYQDELARSMRARLACNRAKKTGSSSAGSNRELLFKKVMTPSDVGRLHRLVIPKHYAESYLPKIVHEEMGREAMLNFEDGNKDRMWRFKYCYWKSSQNYVLTKGWGEFVKDKGLKAGDTVLFYCNLEGSDTKFSIDTSCQPKVVNDISDDHSGDENRNSNDSDSNSNSNGEVALSGSNVVIRLFGVDICSSVGAREMHGGRSSQLDGGEVVQTQGVDLKKIL